MFNKTSKPIYSVVIPAYKRTDLVTEALNSVLRQKRINKNEVEIIISDDEDDSKQRAKNKKYFIKLAPNVKYVVNRHQEGPGGNRQTGFDLAKGKYVVFLDSDDRLMPDFLFKTSNYLIKGRFAAVVCLSHSIYEKGFGVWEQVKLIPLTFVRDVAIWSGYLFNSNCIYPASFYLCQFSHMIFDREIIGGQKFNYDYRYGGEDWDFFIQTLKKGRIGILPEKLLLFRYAPGSSTVNPNNKINKWNSYLLLASKLKPNFKKGMFYYLFLRYIGLYGGKNAAKN